MAEQQHNQMADRVARQMGIDEEIVFPQWSKYVDIPLLEMYCACEWPPTPVIMLPELKLSSLLKNLIICTRTHAKIMIVDETDSKFDVMRRHVPARDIGVYYSTQELSTLNYASRSFHFILTHVGLTTLNKMNAVFSSFRRVLKPDMHLIWSVPLVGSFGCFFDILEECLATEVPRRYGQIMNDLRKAMDEEVSRSMASDLGFSLEGKDITEFEIDFPDVDTMLFSSLVEAHYLAFCLSLVNDVPNPRQLLTNVVKSFHTYFDGMKVKVPMRIGIYNARKLDI